MTCKHPDDYEREDRREGCTSYDVTYEWVRVTTRARNPQDAKTLADDALRDAYADVPCAATVEVSDEQ